jgi:hypothetical protein
MPTLSELLRSATLDAVISKMLGVFQSAGFPVTDWDSSGGSERTRIKAFATALKDLAADLIPAIAAGGFIDYATGAWLKLTAKQMYDLDYVAASYTVGTIRLTCAPSAGPHTLSVGQTLFKFPSGNRYTLSALPNGNVLASGGTLDVTVTSESPNQSALGLNYIDPSNASPIVMTKPLTGVTATNPAPAYSPVTQIGTGTGTVTPSGSPNSAHQVVIRIDTNGQAGVASWSYSIDGGAFVSAGAVSSATNLGGYGIDVTLSNGSVSPSFLTNDLYNFSTPGTWITTQGRDEESDVALRARSKNRWPSLNSYGASSPTLGFYDLLVRESSTQITQTRVQTDGTINNKVWIVIAGQGGALPPAVVSAADAFVKKRVPITDFPVVVSPTIRTITLSGTVTVEREKETAAKAAAEAAVRTYINTTVGINGIVRLAEIIDALMSTDGIIDVTGLQINGASANLALPVVAGAFELPSWTQAIASALTWTTS